MMKRTPSGRFAKGNKGFWLGKKRGKEFGKKMSNALKGKTAWNKGLTKTSDPRVASYSKKLEGRVSPTKGKPRSEETKKKISKALMGHPCWGGFQKGGPYYPPKGPVKYNPWHKGTKGIIKANKGSFKKGETKISGKNNYNWKGGITSKTILLRHSKQHREWSADILKRDGYVCINCGDSSGGNLVAHHIKPFASFPKLRLQKNNGITLCCKCHYKIHGYSCSS